MRGLWSGWRIGLGESVVLVDDYGSSQGDAGGNEGYDDPLVVPEPLHARQDQATDQATFQEPQNRPRMFLLRLALGLECEVYFLQIREDLLP